MILLILILFSAFALLGNNYFTLFILEKGNYYSSGAVFLSTGLQVALLASCFFVLLLPKGKITSAFLGIALGAFTALLNTLAIAAYAFDKISVISGSFAEYDLVLHFLGGLSVGLIATAFYPVKEKFRFVAAVAGASLGAGTVWETTEAQLGVTGNSIDTITDLAAVAVGGSVAVLLCLGYTLLKKENPAC